MRGGALHNFELKVLCLEICQVLIVVSSARGACNEMLSPSLLTVLGGCGCERELASSN